MQTNFSLKLSRFFVYSAIFLVPFYFLRFSIGQLRTNIFEVVVLVALLNTLYVIRNTKKVVWGSIWSYLFLLISFISIFSTSDKTAALGIFKGWFLVPILLYWLVINLFVRKDLYRLTLVLFVSLIIVGLWSLLQNFGIISTLFYQKGDASFLQYLRSDNFRIFGPFESPNYLAMYLAPVLFLCLPLLMHFRKMPMLRTLTLLLMFGIAIYVLLMTGSRAGIIAFAIPFVLLVLLKNRAVPDDDRKTKGLRVVSLAVVALMFILILSRVSTDRSESNSSRLQIYQYALEIGKTDPVLGIGLGSFQTKIAEISKNDIDFQVKTLPSALHPHNIYLALWLNLGILGLIVFIIIVANFFHRLWPQRNYYLALCLMAAMVAILIHGLFDTTYFKNDLSAIFWLILAFAELIIIGKNAEN